MAFRKRIWVGLSLCLGLSALAVPTGVNAYKRWRNASHRASLKNFLQSADPEARWQPSPEFIAEKREELNRTRSRGKSPRRELEAEWDEPFMRGVAWRNLYGAPSPELTSRWARIARQEASKWADRMPGARRKKGAASGPVSGLSWVNIGPDDAKYEWNGERYYEVDSGRTTGIAVHPGDPDIVYTATSGGGVWKTYDFSSLNPTWAPVTETIGNLAIGAMAMDPAHPDTLYIGLGDAYDVGGGQILKTTDGGATWSAPVNLSGTYSLGGSTLPVTAMRVRALQVDPNNANVVLAGTDVGLFRSTDGGQSFALVDLPNADTAVAENVWSIVYTGQVGGVSRWALSGVYAESPGAKPPDPGFGTVANPGDIWVSSDAGATWDSRRVAGVFPDTAVGRIDLAAGTPTPGENPTAVVYAQLSVDDEFNGPHGAGYWRSLDSGQTFAAMGGQLSNPTADCYALDVNGEQSWYNAAIAVDPADSNHLITGGQLCGLRTLNGTSDNPTWEVVSDWLPVGGGADTPQGRLPYVHADWHTLHFARTASGYIVIAGTDGGLFASRDVLTPGPVNDTTVRWAYPNRGIVSHLFYSVSSGDEVTGDASVAYGGLQDNGTRFRDAKHPTAFNQVIGGDGFGSTLASVPGDATYWASIYYLPVLCDPDTSDCSDTYNWYAYGPSDDQVDQQLPCLGDYQPFNIQLTNVRTATPESGTAILFPTVYGLYRYKGDPFSAKAGPWEQLGNMDVTDSTGACVDPYSASQRGNATASATVDGLYGVALSGGRFRVTSNCTLDTPGSECGFRVTEPTGVDLDGDGQISRAERLTGAISLDFPPGPIAELPGQVFVGASVAVTNGAGEPVPDALGHLFLTRDGGQTWTALKGNGTGFDLPNVPVNIVRYDPGDLTNNTIYAGTDLGLYRTTDGGQTWQRFGYGLPMVKVTDMFISRTGAFLRVSTFGRGLWEIHPSATAEKGVNGNGDFDRNFQIDYVDLLSTANRLGTTPATQQAPLYDWNQDVTGSVNAIDDTDLGQLLSRYGGRP